MKAVAVVALALASARLADAQELHDGQASRQLANKDIDVLRFALNLEASVRAACAVHSFT